MLRVAAAAAGPLTLLSGANASGRSSVLQALVLLHQTLREGEWSTRLMLNDEAIQLGTTDESALSLAKCLRDLTYITAERTGPREIYPIDDRQNATLVGPQGGHTVSLLQWGRDEQVLADLALPEVVPTRLRQVEARMDMFFPGFRLAVQPVPQANAVILGLRTSDDTDFHRPIHAGFGLTQVFLIVVAALSAARGEYPC